MAIGTAIFDQSPFENCIVMGHVMDENGKKMSKHTGNVVDPWSILDKQGADAVRWYFYTAGAPWLPSRFSDKLVSEGQRKFMATLQNTYAFLCSMPISTALTQGYDLATVKLTLMDKWILSRLNQLVKQVDEDLTAYRIPEVKPTPSPPLWTT